MNHPEFITFTGVDDYTDIGAMSALSDEYPIEWGVLIGGRPGKVRYPSVARINELVALAMNIQYTWWFRLSLHLCGTYAQRAMTNIELPENEIDIRGFGRVQVNAPTYDMDALGKLAEKYGVDVIFQHRDGPFPINLPPGVFPLHDPSGGRGTVPSERPIQTANCGLVGYAGGIRPENIHEALDSMNRPVNYWIDMETGVRTNDRFDLTRCEAVCKAVYSDNGPRSIQRFMQGYPGRFKAAVDIAEEWVGAVAAMPVERKSIELLAREIFTTLIGNGTVLPKGTVKYPTTADEAAMMNLISEQWLRAHAPDRLKKDPT